MALQLGLSDNKAPKPEILNNIVHGRRLSPLFEKELEYAVDEYVIDAAGKRSNEIYMVGINISS